MIVFPWKQVFFILVTNFIIVFENIEINICKTYLRVITFNLVFSVKTIKHQNFFLPSSKKVIKVQNEEKQQFEVFMNNSNIRYVLI